MTKAEEDLYFALSLAFAGDITYDCFKAWTIKWGFSALEIANLLIEEVRRNFDTIPASDLAKITRIVGGTFGWSQQILSNLLQAMPGGRTFHSTFRTMGHLGGWPLNMIMRKKIPDAIFLPLDVSSIPSIKQSGSLAIHLKEAFAEEIEAFGFLSNPFYETYGKDVESLIIFCFDDETSYTLAKVKFGEKPIRDRDEIFKRIRRP